jgi:RNA polymerase sigma-B factor
MTNAALADVPVVHDGLHERRLWRRLTCERDQAAREELVRLYMPMARRMAARYAGVVEPYDDLVQVASVGLLNAVDRFDVSRGTPFAGFAKPTIMGELKRYFRDKVWTIRVPRAIHDRMARVESMTEDLTEELSRPPTTQELAARLGLTVSEVLEVLEAERNRQPLGLDAPVAGADGESQAAEWAGAVDGGYELVEDRMMLERVMPGLRPQERQILRMRFIEELPQSQIAVRIGCSQMQVSRLLRAILERLRERADLAPAGRQAA